MAGPGIGLDMAGHVLGTAGEGIATDYRSQVARNNQIILQQKAFDAEQAGRVHATNQLMKTTDRVSNQRTGFAGNGIDVNSGSAKSVQDSTMALGELDAATILHNALKTSLGYKNEAANIKWKSEFDEKTLPLRLASSLVSGATSVGDKWLKWKSKTGDGGDTADGEADYEGP